jgi:S1-C subfamily serine protease
MIAAGCSSERQSADVAWPMQVSVRITCGNLSGNGVIWEEKDGEAVVATAGHVLEAGRDISVTFFDGRQVTASEFVKSTQADLAFIRLDTSKNKYPSVTKKTDKNEILVQEQIVFSYEWQGDDFTPHLGIVQEPWIYMDDFAQYMIYLNMKTAPGMSGGGVFDEQDRLVGILCGGTEDGEAAAVPLSLMESIYISENF